MKNIKEKYKQMNWKQRTALFIVMLTLTMSSAFAIWNIFLTDTSIVTITSTEPLLIGTTFSNTNYDASSESGTTTDTMTLNNLDGAIDDITFSSNITRNDNILDTCDDYIDDVELSYTYNGVSKEMPFTDTIPSGTSDLVVIYNVTRFACPQNVTAFITLQAT